MKKQLQWWTWLSWGCLFLQLQFRYFFEKNGKFAKIALDKP